VVGIPDVTPATAVPPVRRRRALPRALRGLTRQPVALAAGVILAVVFVIGALAPVIAPHGANKIDLADRWRNHAPLLSGWHILGTDNIGRDVLLRTLWGLHTSEQSALLATVIATTVGVTIGAIAGHRGGWVDAVLMRFADILGIYPAMLLLVAGYAYFTPVTVTKGMLILASYLWIPAARIVRAEIRSLREREFVQAARSLGGSDRYILLRHLLPNASGAIMIAATSLLGQVIIVEATVEFLGVGPPSELQPTLGNLIGDAQRGVIAFGLGWWTWTGPAAVLVLVLVCANLLGDGVADALRPTRRR
jgi:peptide/nickel transport system permease protein